MKKEDKYFINVEEAKAFTDIFLNEDLQLKQGDVLDKLMHVLKNCLYGEKDSHFEKYLSTHGMVQQSFCGGRVNDTSTYFKKGWKWERIIGPYEIQEINLRGLFLYEVTLFANCYLVYTHMSNTDYEYKILISKPIESIIDFMIEARAFYDTYTSLLCPDDSSEEIYYGFLLRGAWYIDSKVNHYKLKPQVMYELQEAYKEVGNCPSIISVTQYFDSFFRKIRKEYGYFGKTALNIAFPFLLDVYTGLRVESANGYTPTLYFFSSEGLKEYHDIRDACINHPYVGYLDKLCEFLKDPAAVLRNHRDDLMFVDKCTEVVANETICTRFVYTKKEYVVIYYYFDYKNEDCDYPIKINHIFFAVREVFDVLLQGLKKDMNML